jgi:hypothetical protein
MDATFRNVRGLQVRADRIEKVRDRIGQAIHRSDERQGHHRENQPILDQILTGVVADEREQEVRADRHSSHRWPFVPLQVRPCAPEKKARMIIVTMNPRRWAGNSRSGLLLQCARDAGRKLHISRRKRGDEGLPSAIDCSKLGQRRRSARSRGVAQPGRAPGSGPGGRRFKSSLPDHL